MKETGSVKFNCTWIKADPLGNDLIKELNGWRNKLYRAALIGVNDEGIGFGNISIRHITHSFIISGSGTGKLEKLSNENYTLVTEIDLDENSLVAKGPVIASSESLTHGVIYKHCKDVNAVMHVHSLTLWEKLLKTHPHTKAEVEYGTPAMAKEVIRLFDETPLRGLKIFGMGGHYEGVIAFGKDLDEAGNTLLDLIVQAESEG
jgi:L-ribulose-5-phosphate 4-epimerase